MTEDFHAMSPNRPERDGERQSTEPTSRYPGVVQAIEVSGPAEVEARIEMQLAQCRRRRSVMALLCVSVEEMHWTPDAWSAGFERLVRDEVTHRICNGVRSGDRVLRESERDACVLLPDAADGVADLVATRLARRLNGDYQVADQSVQVLVRIGRASHPRDGVRAIELLRQATERR
jgi:GGDEF domain-containing protein